MIENKAELNELRIQEDRSRRNNIKVEGIDEDENERSFLYDELENTDELYIYREQTVLEEEKVSTLIVIKLLEYLLRLLTIDRL